MIPLCNRFRVARINILRYGYWAVLERGCLAGRQAAQQSQAKIFFLTFFSSHFTNFSSHFTNIGGGLLRPNVASQALMTSKILPSWLSGAIMFIPKARPLNFVARPRGTVATGYPATAAMLAIRPSAGPMITSILFSSKVCLIFLRVQSLVLSNPFV